MDNIKPVVKRRAIKQKRRTRVILLAVVGGVLLGIFGMHNPSQEHSQEHPAQSHSARSTAASQSTQAGAMAADTMDGHNQREKDPSAPDGHCGMLVLCLAAIGGGALLLWAAFVACRRRPTAHLKRASVTVRTFVQSVFKPPPDLISLSILRC